MALATVPKNDERKKVTIVRQQSNREDIPWKWRQSVKANAITSPNIKITTKATDVHTRKHIHIQKNSVVKVQKEKRMNVCVTNPQNTTHKKFENALRCISVSNNWNEIIIQVLVVHKTKSIANFLLYEQFIHSMMSYCLLHNLAIKADNRLSFREVNRLL